MERQKMKFNSESNQLSEFFNARLNDEEMKKIISDVICEDFLKEGRFDWRESIKYIDNNYKDNNFSMLLFMCGYIKGLNEKNYY